MSSVESKKKAVRVAICQIPVGSDKKKNILTARKSIQKAITNGAQLVILPEIWNSPYATSAFPIYAESVPEVGEYVNEYDESCQMLSQEAKKGNVWLIGGSISEHSKNNQVYNTCPVFSPEGNLVAKHRKVHLFDINVPGKIKFFESETLTAGDQVTVLDTPFGKIGIGICYDMRFHQLSTLMREKGASLMVYPGAFNMTTGPLHWEALARARAIDNQCYVVVASPARSEDKTMYQAWGHSSVIDPWGKVEATTDHQPDIVYATLDFSRVEEVRQHIPVFRQKRVDLYETIQK